MNRKPKEPYFQGTEPVYGKAAKRLHRLIMNPPKATPEEKERMRQNYEYFKSISTCKLL